MTPNNKPRKKLSNTELQAKREIVLARKAIIAENKAKELEQKSVIFRKLPGKIVWWFCLATSIFSAIILIDGWLGKQYSKFDIHSSIEDRVDVLSSDGWWVPATFNWVYLDGQKKLGIHMYKTEFKKVEQNGYLELGRSPIFKVPYNFKIVIPDEEPQIKELQHEYGYTSFLPIFLFIICTSWLFAKPHLGFQMIIYGYFNMFVTPFIVLLLTMRIIEFISNVGMYEIHFSGLILAK